LPFNYKITQLPNYKIEDSKAFMANTKKLSKEDRKKAKRTARKKRATEHPLKPREYARGSKKSKVKKMARGTAKR
jgi:mRNA-degrading endonuclease RelE of RelBE toxin-antitoxin system